MKSLYPSLSMDGHINTFERASKFENQRAHWGVLGAFGQNLYNSVKSVVPNNLWQGHPIAQAFGYEAPKSYAQTAPQQSSFQNPNQAKFQSGNAFQQYANSAPTGGSYGGGAAPAPATGGQSAGGGDAGGGGQDQYLQQLRDAFGGQRQSLENQINSYGGDLTNAQTSTDQSIKAAQDAKTQQDQGDSVLYGQNLKNLLQSNQELSQRRQGTYSALGSLDSSAFQQDTAKADQALLDNQQQLGTQRDSALHNRESQYNSYANDAQSKLGAYKQDIARAQEGLRGAQSGVDLNQANSIQSYMQQMQQQQQAAQAQQQALAMNLAQLQAQGVDVLGNLQKTNIGDYSKQFGANLQQQLAQGTARYQTPVGTQSQAGYIGAGNPNDPLKRLLGQ